MVVRFPLPMLVTVCAVFGAASGLAQTCTHPAGNTPFGLMGDANGSGSRNVADALCVILGSLEDAAGGSAADVPCMDSAVGADLSCDGTVTIVDITACIHLILNGTVPTGLTPDADGCPAACASCAPPGGSSCLIEGACVPEGFRTGADLCQVCDPAQDPGAYTVETCQTYYLDLDGDGFGQTGATLCACQPIAAYSATIDGDCDDTEPSAFPGNPEVCTDGIDNDCSGTPDDTGCGPKPESCLHILLEDPGAASGIYPIDPDGAGPGAAIDVYCDMSTDGGGWTLMAKFSQDNGIQTLSSGDYDSYFRQALWIEGASEGPPTDPTPAYDGGAHIESVVWTEHLAAGRSYEIRQNFHRNDGTNPSADKLFDAKWDFTYSGYTTQNAAPEAQRAWTLTNRTVLADHTGISWNVDPDYQLFWLPFTDAVTGNVYTGCSGYQFSTSGCSMADLSLRRHGSAGIIGHTADLADPAGSWAPHVRIPDGANSLWDLVYVHQGPDVYGATGSDMVLLYWTRERELCATDADCNSGICHSDHRCALPLSSCQALLDAGVTASGVYTLDFDGPDGALAPVDAYCDQVTASGGWMYVAEPGRSQTDPTDTFISGPGSYHRYIYDLRGKTYDEVLVVRPADKYWCNSWGSDSTYWGEAGVASMGIAYDTSSFHYHNGETIPYAWIQQAYKIAGSCSNCWQSNNTTPSPVAIAALDGAGSMVHLDPPGSTLARLEVSNYDAFINQAGGCNLSAGNLATWATYVRGEPNGGVAQLHGPAQVFGNGWTDVAFDSVHLSEGITARTDGIRFTRPGVYRVTLSYRSGAGGDVWTAVRLFGDGAIQGTSAGYGNINGTSPELFTTSFLATVPTIDDVYQLQVGRLASSASVIAPDQIVDVTPAAVQATFELIDENLAAPTRSFAQIEGAAQTFAANAWTPTSIASTPIANGISASGTAITLTQAGVYRVTLSYRQGAGGDVWTAGGFFANGAPMGLSAGYGNVPSSPELFTVSFLANVVDTGLTHTISMGRLPAPITVITPSAISGFTPPAVQGTIVRETGSASSFAQLQGSSQVFAASAWTAASFNAAPIAQGIDASGTNLTLSEPGIYRVTLSYRHGGGGDVWTAARLYATNNQVIEGYSAGYGNVNNSPELFTTSFLARVTDTATTHQIQLGRLSSGTTVVQPSAISGFTPPAIQATVVRIADP